jgi:predicted glycosyltransferase
VKVWIDVDNPPQVQYLVPFVRAFEARGAEVVVTARDYGHTFELLRKRGVEFRPVGHAFGASKLHKATGSFRRAASLRLRVGRPDVLLCASRPSALASRALGIPSYVVADYEYANVSVYRWTRSIFLHPEVIDGGVFLERGLRNGQLIPFRGLKEDLSFADVELDAVPAWEPPGPAGLVRVLVRPPAEDSHYYAEASRPLALALLAWLAERDDVQLVFSPRYPRQVADVEALRWRNEPVVLRRPVPFVSLLKGVDAVVCSGGTMLREAAYLGVPAYSILQSQIGGVDRHLEAIGRVRFVGSADELDRIALGKRNGLDPLAGNPRLLDELADTVLAAA